MINRELLIQDKRRKDKLKKLKEQEETSKMNLKCMSAEKKEREMRRIFKRDFKKIQDFERIETRFALVYKQNIEKMFSRLD